VSDLSFVMVVTAVVVATVVGWVGELVMGNEYGISAYLVVFFFFFHEFGVIGYFQSIVL